MVEGLAQVPSPYPCPCPSGHPRKWLDLCSLCHSEGVLYLSFCGKSGLQTATTGPDQGCRWGCRPATRPLPLREGRGHASGAQASALADG